MTMNRARRRLLARKLEVSRAAEARYVRALRGVMRDVHGEMLSFLLSRSDANLPSNFEEVLSHVLEGIPVRVGALFDRHAAKVDAANKKAMRLVGVKAASDPRIAPDVAKRRAENIDLVVKAGRTYATDVRNLFGDPDNFGLRVEDLKEKLQERAIISESRAELIARDQTLKLNGAITQIRQEAAGVEEYIWSTSLDERVRDSHRVLEGQRFAWSSPPEPGHPGQDYQCRCVALPVIAELEGL